MSSELLPVAGTDVALFWAVKAAIRILTVDNEPSVTLSLRYVFDGPQYEVTGVDSGQAALAKLDANAGLYDVIIVDEKMPNMSGVQLVKAIRERCIAGKIIVVSAFLSTAVCEAYGQLDVDVMFSKPFNVDDLRTAVDHLVV